MVNAEKREERDSALATFKKPGGPKVILIRCVEHLIGSPFSLG
jgi:hypothetical protein